MQRSSAQLPAEAQPLHLGQSRDILLVEDNEINRLVAHGMLTRLGHRITLAEDGRSALALVTERPFELALLDINLPDMDGMTLREDLTAISEEVHERPLPAIAISAQMYPEDIRHCLAAGFVDFVGKPVRLAVLANAIEQLFRQDASPIASPVPLSVAVSTTRPEFSNPVLDADLPLLGMARIRQLVALFESQGRVLVDKLAQGEGSEQRQLAHKLKGSALALGLTEFASHCAALEAGGGEPATIGAQFDAAVSGLQQWLTANRDAPF